MRLALHLREAEVTLKIFEENKIYILNHQAIINEATSYLRGAIDTLILDLENIKFIDSSGLGALIKLNNLANDMNKRLRVANLSEDTMEIFELLKLSEAFDIKTKSVAKISSAA